MSDTERQEERQTTHLLFIGVRKSNRDSKKKCLWHEIDPEDNTGDPLQYDEDKEHWYSGKNATLKSHATPGSIISIETAENGNVYPGTSRLVSVWENEDDVVHWRSLSRAAEGEIAKDQKIAKDARQDLVAERLEPFRRAYWNCSNKRQEAQLLAWIIQQITEPLSLKKKSRRK